MKRCKIIWSWFQQAWALQEADSSPRSSSAAPSVWRCLWNPFPRRVATASARPACRATGTTARNSSAPCARRATPKSPRWASTGCWRRFLRSSRAWRWVEGPPRGVPWWIRVLTRAGWPLQARTPGSLPGTERCPVTPASGGSWKLTNPVWTARDHSAKPTSDITKRSVSQKDKCPRLSSRGFGLFAGWRKNYRRRFVRHEIAIKVNFGLCDQTCWRWGQLKWDFSFLSERWNSFCHLSVLDVPSSTLWIQCCF